MTASMNVMKLLSHICVSLSYHPCLQAKLLPFLSNTNCSWYIDTMVWGSFNIFIYLMPLQSCSFPLQLHKELIIWKLFTVWGLMLKYSHNFFIASSTLFDMIVALSTYAVGKHSVPSHCLSRLLVSSKDWSHPDMTCNQVVLQSSRWEQKAVSENFNSHNNETIRVLLTYSQISEPRTVQNFFLHWSCDMCI